MKVFRALNDQEIKSNKIGDKTFKELCNKTKEEVISDIQKHVLLGNFQESHWNSLSEEFVTAYGYSRPSIIRNKSNKNIKKVKIKPTYIAVAEFDPTSMIKREQYSEYISNRAHNYSKNTSEVLSGCIESFDILYKFQMDLLYILYYQDKSRTNETKYIDTILNLQDDFKLELTALELLIFDLFYNNNRNFYEIIAPIFVSQKLDILVYYECLFDIIAKILKKGAKYYFDDEIELNRITKPLKQVMYHCEMNFICVDGYKDDGYQANRKLSDSKVDFGGLLEVYEDIIDKDTMESCYSSILDLTYSEIDCCKEYPLTRGPIMESEKEYPLYLYLPRKVTYSVLSGRCIKFTGKRFKIYNFVAKDKEDSTLYNHLMKESDRYTFVGGSLLNLGHFASEIYISPQYRRVESDSLNSENIGADCLVKVFGGINLIDKEEISFAKRKFCKSIDKI